MNPDVVLMDIGLPGMSGIQCVSELKRTNPALQIIMVTIYEDSERIFKALRAGASGYLLKSGPPPRCDTRPPCRPMSLCLGPHSECAASRR